MRGIIIPGIKFFSQFDEANVERAGPTACFRACRAMAATVGKSIPESTIKRIQVAKGEDQNTGLVVVDEAQAKRGYAEVLRCLGVGIPVVLGVNYKRGSLNRDGTTDHYVLAVGTDPSRQPEPAIIVFDPGRSIPEGETHNSEWMWDSLSGNMKRSWPQGRSWLPMECSMVVLPEGA